MTYSLGHSQVTSDLTMHTCQLEERSVKHKHTPKAYIVPSYSPTEQHTPQHSIQEGPLNRDSWPECVHTKEFNRLPIFTENTSQNCQACTNQLIKHSLNAPISGGHSTQRRSAAPTIDTSMLQLLHAPIFTRVQLSLFLTPLTLWARWLKVH